MSTACEVRRVLSSKPQEHKLDHLRLTFQGGTPGDPDEEEGDELEDRKKRDMAAFGRGGIYTPPPPQVPGRVDVEDEDGTSGFEEEEEYTRRDTSRWEDPLT